MNFDMKNEQRVVSRYQYWKLIKFKGFWTLNKCDKPRHFTSMLSLHHFKLFKRELFPVLLPASGFPLPQPFPYLFNGLERSAYSALLMATQILEWTRYYKNASAAFLHLISSHTFLISWKLQVWFYGPRGNISGKHMKKFLWVIFNKIYTIWSKGGYPLRHKWKFYYSKLKNKIYFKRFLVIK